MIINRVLENVASVGHGRGQRTFTFDRTSIPLLQSLDSWRKFYVVRSDAKLPETDLTEGYKCVYLAVALNFTSLTL